MKEAKIKFQDLEKTIFDYFCDMARTVTMEILKQADEKLMQNRDKNRYRLKRKLKTSIKTIYGDVSYKRRYYFDNETGEYIFLLDEDMDINRIGLYSGNMVEHIAATCINESYGKAAETISNTTGLNISKVACWKIVQSLGVKIESHESELIQAEKNEVAGEKEVKALFEETDGVWLRQQLPDKKSGPKMEAKLCTIYEGWQADQPQRLANKTVLGGMGTGTDIMKRRDAVINGIYNVDEIELHVMNGDGAGWIDSMVHGDMIYQLDRFHVLEYINRYIKDRKKNRAIKRLLYENEIGKMLEYIEMYADSIDGSKPEKEVEEVRNLFRYLKNHEDNIILYKDREDIRIPEPAPGIIYKNMGVQENQNCSLITMRMKGRRMRWSKSGANNFIKVVCCKENKQLSRFTQDMDGMISYLDIDKEAKQVLSAGAIQKKVGKGNKYIELINQAVPAASATMSPLTAVLRKIMA